MTRIALLCLWLAGCATVPTPHYEVGGGFATTEDGRTIWWDESVPAEQPGKR